MRDTGQPEQTGAASPSTDCPLWWAAGIEDTFITAPHPVTGRTLDEYALTGHYDRWASDIDLMAELGVGAARYGIPWHKLQTASGKWDWTTADGPLERLLAHGITPQIDLVHYGLPLWIEGGFLNPDYPRYVGDYAARVAERYRGRIHWYTPLNEPRITAWYCGRLGWWPPHERSWAGFVRVMLAICRGIRATVQALKSVDPDIIDYHVDATDLYRSADPELGGSPRHLDVIGINDYWTNQWEWGAAPGADGIIAPLADDDPRRLPLTDLIRSVSDRYGHELIISETSHIGDHRAAWIYEVARAATTLVGEGVPLKGVCLYPIQGMPEWHAPEIWPALGLWEPADCTAPHNGRITHLPMLSALHDVRHWPLCIEHRARHARHRPEPIRRRG